MSLRTIQRTAILSVLALGALSASGCDDDETKDTTDAGDNGGNNNNNNNNGDVDAGEEDAGGPKPLMCDNSDDACTDNNLGGITLKACCTEGADVCGLDTSVLAAVGVPFAGCYERAAPGVASDFCGDFFDMIDVKAGDKQFNLSIAQRMLDAATGFCAELTDEQREAAIKFSPCCTPTGECGVFIDNVEFMGSFNLDLGCVAASELMPAPEENPVCTNNPATARRPTTLPYCNADTGAGECPEKLNATICGPLAGAGIACTPGETTPDFVCTWFGLPKKGESAPPTITTCMPGVAEYVQGCGPGAGNGRCIPNVPTTIYGCVDVTAANPPALPEYLCGCGNDKTAFPAPADKFPCLANVDVAVCGTVQQTTPIAQPGAFNSVCGCGPTTKYNPAAGLPCWSNVETTICGATPVTTVDKANVADTKCVPNYPEILLGCGPGNTSSYPPTCIPNAATTVGGCLEVTTGSPFLATTLNMFCGCGPTVRNTTSDPTNAAFCLSYVEAGVCGPNPVCTPVSGDCDPDGAGTVFGATGGTCRDNEPETPDTIGDFCQPKP